MANTKQTGGEQNGGQAADITPPVKIKIIVEGHEDGGKAVAKGATVEVPEAVAKMLVEQKIGTPA